jgi:hypothetical protein
MKTGYTTLGDQQILDIELDRKTETLPPRPNPIKWNDSSFSTVSETSVWMGEGKESLLSPGKIIPIVITPLLKNLAQDIPRFSCHFFHAHR